jgi:hypothetical protein
VNSQLSKIAVFAVAAVCLAVWASPAAAKDALAVRVCGDSGCVLTTDRPTLRRFMSGLDGSPAPVEAPDPAPYLRVDLAIGPEGQPVEDSWTFYYLPEKHLMATNGEPGEIFWYPVSQAAPAMFREVSVGITPFGAPREWPKVIEPSADFDASAIAEEAKDAAAGADAATEQTSASTRVETSGSGFWSKWFILPLAAVALIGAAAVTRRRQGH